MTAANNRRDPAEMGVAHAMSIDDAYRIERALSRGARCITELVTIDGAGPFIRKKIPPKIAHRTAWAALADCSGPGLPRIHATYETPDWFVVIHDYAPGETIEKLVAEQGRLSLGNTLSIAENLCSAVAEPHAHGIVHRDISPANVVVSFDAAGNADARLIDFGNARMAYEQSTSDDATQGTWGFAAPEQHGFAQADARSDIYSLGKLLGFMLAGARPGSSEDGVYLQRLADPAIVPPWLRTVLDHACAFEPSARYRSAEAFAEALRSATRPETGRSAYPEPNPAAGGNGNPAPASRMAAPGAGLGSGFSQPAAAPMGAGAPANTTAPRGARERLQAPPLHAPPCREAPWDRQAAPCPQMPPPRPAEPIPASSSRCSASPSSPWSALGPQPSSPRCIRARRPPPARTPPPRRTTKETLATALPTPYPETCSTSPRAPTATKARLPRKTPPNPPSSN